MSYNGALSLEVQSSLYRQSLCIPDAVQITFEPVSPADAEPFVYLGQLNSKRYEWRFEKLQSFKNLVIPLI